MTGRTFWLTVEATTHDDPPARPMTESEVREMLDQALYEGFKHVPCSVHVVVADQEE